MFQEKSPSSVSTMAVIEDLRIRRTEKSILTFTLQTNRTTAKFVAATNPTLILPPWENTWKFTVRALHLQEAATKATTPLLLQEHRHPIPTSAARRPSYRPVKRILITLVENALLILHLYLPLPMAWIITLLIPLQISANGMFVKVQVVCLHHPVTNIVQYHLCRDPSYPPRRCSEDNSASLRFALFFCTFCRLFSFFSVQKFIPLICKYQRHFVETHYIFFHWKLYIFKYTINSSSSFWSWMLK